MLLPESDMFWTLVILWCLPPVLILLGSTFRMPVQGDEPSEPPWTFWQCMYRYPIGIVAMLFFWPFLFKRPRDGGQ
jgi:hypothetical protein